MTVDPLPGSGEPSSAPTIPASPGPSSDSIPSAEMVDDDTASVSSDSSVDLSYFEEVDRRQEDPMEEQKLVLDSIDMWRREEDTVHRVVEASFESLRKERKKLNDVEASGSREGGADDDDTTEAKTPPPTK